MNRTILYKSQHSLPMGKRKFCGIIEENYPPSEKFAFHLLSKVCGVKIVDFLMKAKSQKKRRKKIIKEAKM